MEQNFWCLTTRRSRVLICKQTARVTNWDRVCKYTANVIHTLLKVLLFLKPVFSDSSVKKMCLFFILICRLMSKDFDFRFMFFCRYLTRRWLKLEIPPYLWPNQKQWTQTWGSTYLLLYTKREETNNFHYLLLAVNTFISFF